MSEDVTVRQQVLHACEERAGGTEGFRQACTRPRLSDMKAEELLPKPIPVEIPLTYLRLGPHRDAGIGPSGCHLRVWR